jgi:streptomycin 6-kinase
MNISSKSPLEQLKIKAAEWNVTLDETRETVTSALGFGAREGRKVVLKVAKQEGDESYSGRILQAFDGDGAVRVYEFETGAVLLERLEPGEQLVSLVRRGEDDRATEILAQVMNKLRHHQPPAGCPTVAGWGRGFDRYLQSGDQQIPREFVVEAHSLYQELTASQRKTMLLHGDLQHYNVLLDDERGWVAIDPKGVVGELECELGALLRNPVEQPGLFANPATVHRRLETLSNLLHLDHTRALHWSFAQAVLSAIWDIEDGYHLEQNNPSLLLAQVLVKIKSRSQT